MVTKAKSDFLRDAGYVYTWNRELYVNRKTKKAFSIDFVEDHSEDQLREYIGQETGGPAWRFYFNSEPSESVRRELQGVLRHL